MKICNICKIDKELDFFGVLKTAKDGRNKTCKECRNKRNHTNSDKNKKKYKEYYVKNKERKKQIWSESKKKYTAKNKERKKEYDREYAKRPEVIKRIKNYHRTEEVIERRKKRNQRPDIKKKAAEYIKKKMQDPKKHLDKVFSQGIRESLKKKKIFKNNKKWETILGYSILDLMSHLESKFTPEMSWDNYGKYWHIDHIKPKSLFIYSSMEDEEFKKCWSLDNLQPLEAVENIRKGNKYLEPAKLDKDMLSL
jgi:hypothetical protein